MSLSWSLTLLEGNRLAALEPTPFGIVESSVLEDAWRSSFLMNLGLIVFGSELAREASEWLSACPEVFFRTSLLRLMTLEESYEGPRATFIPLSVELSMDGLFILLLESSFEGVVVSLGF